MWCIVNLPNGTQQAVNCDSKAIGQECLEKVCKALNIICEMEYLGLKHWSPNQASTHCRQWINLRNRLTCDGSKGLQLTLALRVKFWVPVHMILQESMRNLFYMQAKSDLLEGRLKARNWSNAAKLAALLCQADGVQFKKTSLDAKDPMHIKNNSDTTNQQQENQCKDKKEKDHVLSFKKRRLSKQKSLESIDNTLHPQLRSKLALAALSTRPCNSITVTNESVDRHLHTQTDCDETERRLSDSPLGIYQNYIICLEDGLSIPMPDDFLHQIAVEHGNYSLLQIKPHSAKYWLLREIQDLSGYGEELFPGVIHNEIHCSAAVGAYGVTVSSSTEEKITIPFSAITSAKASSRIFKLEYVNEYNVQKDLEIKSPKDVIAEGLYRAITERHAFYICDKVRGVVTNQFKRDFKGTIASMFKEDTDLGKRYVFDVQHTCREVHDQARRILHDSGMEKTSQFISHSILADSKSILKDAAELSCSNDVSEYLDSTNSLMHKLDQAVREKEQRDAAIERCVEIRISEAMTCKICMDQPINTLFNPCCHVMSCSSCALRCSKCPSCRVDITSLSKIYLPPELRTNQFDNTNINSVVGSSNAVNISKDEPLPSTTLNSPKEPETT